VSVAEIEAQVREFVWSSFLADSGISTFRNSDDLFDLLDSLQVLRLVVQLERLFGVKVADYELAHENLGSVQKVAAFVARKCESCQSMGGGQTA
jgi:acyl carrier protein